jgi:hypothetical protein
MLAPEEKWILHVGVEIWDYEKTFYEVVQKDGTYRWAYPNAGKLTDAGFTETSGEEIPIDTINAYREAEDDYFLYIENYKFDKIKILV